VEEADGSRLHRKIVSRFVLTRNNLKMSEKSVLFDTIAVSNELRPKF